MEQKINLILKEMRKTNQLLYAVLSLYNEPDKKEFMDKIDSIMNGDQNVPH